MEAAATSCTTCRNAGEFCSTDDTDAATRAISGGVMRTGATSGGASSASIVSIAQRIAPLWRWSRFHIHISPCRK